MSKHHEKAAQNLDAILTDDSDMTVEELHAELTEQGVDVDSFLARFGTVVRKGYQHQLRLAAERSAEETRTSALSVFGDLARKTREELESLFTQIREGSLGPGMQTLARCRNQDGNKVSETELRSWLEDIAASCKK